MNSMSETHQKMSQIWARVLSLEPTDFSITDRFVSLGGNSLKSTIAYQMFSDVGIIIHPNDFRRYETIKELASCTIDKDNILKTIDLQISKQLGHSGSAGIREEDLLSQILDSIGFVKLIVNLEQEFHVAISDEDFYEAELITVNDLVNFLLKQMQGELAL